MSSPPASIPLQAGYQKVTVSALFIAYLGGIGVFVPFFPVWLGSVGLGPGWIAILVAAPLFVRVATTSFVADRAERTDDPRKPLRFLAWIAAALFALVPLASLAPQTEGLLNNPWFLLALIAAMSVGWNAVLPLSDALAIQVSRTTGAVYGRMRLWGSATFIVVSSVTGWVVGLYGPQTIPWIILLFFAGFYAVTLVLPPSMAAGHSAPKGRRKQSGWTFVRRRRGAMAVFLGIGLIQASHAVLYSFGSIAWGVQGFSELTIGILWAIGVIVEIALFAASKPIIERMGARGLVLIGGLGGTVRWIILAFSPGLLITAPLQVLHGFSFAMTYLAMIEYVSQRAKPHQLRAAQGVFTVISGAIMGLATLASGPLYEAVGVYSYLAMAVMTAIGLGLVFAARRTIPGGA
ncbi:MAG: MFS transporter [Devosiaceae bacterium]|nr:MFS transporter [Devosiaceae bacterium MH13]